MHHHEKAFQDYKNPIHSFHCGDNSCELNTKKKKKSVKNQLENKMKKYLHVYYHQKI